MVQDVINVVKRGDRGREPLNIDKIHDMVEYAVEDIKGVSSSQVEMQSGLQFYDGMSTDEIQQILIKSAADLISFVKLTRSSPYIFCLFSSSLIVRYFGCSLPKARP